MRENNSGACYRTSHERHVKIRIKRLCLLPLLTAGFVVMPSCRGLAQSFTTLHSFTALNNNTNGDGAYPIAGLVVSGGTLYGTAAYGGGGSNGTVFKLNTDGTGFTNLHNFAGPPNDGGHPNQPLLISDNILYGTALTVFAINTDGTGFTNLHSFTGGGGGNGPQGALVLSGKTLFGTTIYGGSSANGTVFAVDIDGTGFRILYSFTSTGYPDGAGPVAGLVLSGDTLYGTAYRGGYSHGTVFALNTNGTSFTNLYTFGSGSDGANPNASLILSGNVLYGITQYGGDAGNGTLFAINTDGTAFRTVYSFKETSGSLSTNSDGVGPVGGLVLSGNALYGMASGGGQWARGTIFKVNVDGTHFVTLHSFSGNDGRNPYGGLISSGNTFYGTTQSGGSLGKGTVFSISIPPELAIFPSGADVILAWPTNYAGFTLQSTTNLDLPVWTTNLPAPVVINGQNTVTNSLSARQFFRLVK
jgi:uncharacterized repeat protein (TIGR03803 family)